MRLVEDIRRGTTIREAPEESLMLTGDENIVDVEFSVFWLVKPGGVSEYLFNIQHPEGTVKAVAESAMREVIGRSQIQPILTGARQTIEGGVQDLMQRTLDHYGAGIQVTQVQLQKVDPPAQVIDAFRDVQAARIDAERAQNEAQTYANRVVPEARGRVAQITQAVPAHVSRDHGAAVRRHRQDHRGYLEERRGKQHGAVSSLERAAPAGPDAANGKQQMKLSLIRIACTSRCRGTCRLLANEFLASRPPRLSRRLMPSRPS